MYLLKGDNNWPVLMQAIREIGHTGEWLTPLKTVDKLAFIEICDISIIQNMIFELKKELLSLELIIINYKSIKQIVLKYDEQNGLAKKRLTIFSR